MFNLVQILLVDRSSLNHESVRLQKLSNSWKTQEHLTRHSINTAYFSIQFQIHHDFIKIWTSYLTIFPLGARKSTIRRHAWLLAVEYELYQTSTSKLVCCALVYYSWCTMCYCVCLDTKQQQSWYFKVLYANDLALLASQLITTWTDVVIDTAPLCEAH